MNDKSYTYLSTSAKSFSSIDLSFCHPSLFLDYNWSVSKDQHKPNYNEVSLLISEYNPSVFCFQETFLKPDDNISLRGFNIYNYVHTDCLRPSGGASMFVKSSFPQRKIDLQTELQATAVSVTLDREITICSVYIPPSFSLNSQHLDNLTSMVTISSGVVKTMIPEVNLSKISLQRMIFVL